MNCFKDYYLGLKYMGSSNCKKDRKTFGFFGRKIETLDSDVKLSSGKILKSGGTYITELQILCGKK